MPLLTDNWTNGAASRHTITPISHTRPSPHSRSYYSFLIPLRVGGWVGLEEGLLNEFVVVVVEGEVRHLGTVRCRIHFWLIWCKNYQKRSRFAKLLQKVYCQLLLDRSVQLKCMLGLLLPSVTYLLHTVELDILGDFSQQLCCICWLRITPQSLWPTQTHIVILTRQVAHSVSCSIKMT